MNASAISEFDPSSLDTLDDIAIEQFIAGLCNNQCRACLIYEADHGNRANVIAQLAGQLVKTRPAAVDFNTLSLPQQSRVKYALLLATAHVRYPLQGTALAELKTELTDALQMLGLN